MAKLSDKSLEIVARNGYEATDFMSADMTYYITFPNMLKAAQFAHAPVIRAQYHSGIEYMGGNGQDPFHRTVMVWLTER